MLNEAKIMLDDLEEIRQKALDLWMGDPPNVNRGVYTNIYLHTGSKVGDSWANNGWGAGVGTNTYGVPYMALGKGTARDLLSTIYHEAFILCNTMEIAFLILMILLGILKQRLVGLP